MSKAKDSLKKYSRLVLFAVIVAAVVYLIGRNLRMSSNIFLAVMGFSAVVFIHECGHFIAAKVSNIKVETFSIFLPPILLGIKRMEEGFRFRILPKFFPKENDPEENGLLSFTVGKNGKAGETEYRIGLIPVAGYVKMLGQEDIGADKQVTDPRSFGNKSASIRMMVITAGVIFNVITAIVIMTGVYLVGMNALPPVIGGIVPGSPAALAGLKAGDEVIEIAGKSDNLDFGNLSMAAALSDVNEAVKLKVRHEDGSVEDYSIVAKQIPGWPLKEFGFFAATSLTIAQVSDVNALVEKIGLLPGDRIKSINGRDVRAYWELEQTVQDALVPRVAVLAERNKADGETELVESQIRLDLKFSKTYNIDSESELYHVYSLVPRLQIKAVVTRPPSIKDRLKFLLNRTGVKEKHLDIQQELKEGDIILSAGDTDNPTYTELRNIVEKYENKKLTLKVLRTDTNGAEEYLTVSTVPKRRKDIDWVEIGIAIVLDAEHPVVAKTIDTDTGPPALAIPRGATITAVNGEPVSSFYDIINQIHQNEAKHITIDYRLDKQTTGSVDLDIGDAEKAITVKSVFAEYVPFKPLERLYKADGPIDAFVMGSKKSVWFIVQTYVTIKQLFARTVKLKDLSGPVGIAKLTYDAVEYSFISFLYLLAFISANLAVLNFLPIPVTDGGVFVLLIVEKIKGGPVNTRLQEIISFAGLAFLALLILYLTYNDVLRWILT